MSRKLWCKEVYGIRVKAEGRLDEIKKHLDYESAVIHTRVLRVEGLCVDAFVLVVWARGSVHD